MRKIPIGIATLLGIVLILIAIDRVYGQTPAPTPTICTVGGTDKDGARIIKCPEFELALPPDHWPAEWVEQAPGSLVGVRREEGRLVPVMAPCELRIRKRFNEAVELLGRTSIDAISPADCMDISAHDREEFTKTAVLPDRPVERP